MENVKSLDYNYAISKIFSPSFLSQIDTAYHEDYIKDILTSSEIYPSDNWNLNVALDTAYNHLKNNYRCEYVYKNEIANQILLKYHNDNSAVLLKELSSNSSIADLVIVNGHTTAYEIKTELDNFNRLTTQLPSYESIYDYSYIVTYPNAVESLIKKISSDVGIIVLDDTGVLKTVRGAANNESKFDASKAILTLRQAELVAAYKKYNGNLPIMGTALIFDYCFKWFLSLEKIDAHIVFSECLKTRKINLLQFELAKESHPSLKLLFLTNVLSNKKCILIKNKLSIFA